MELSGIFSQFVAIKDLVTKIHFLYFLIVLIFMDFQQKSNSKQRLYKTLGAVSSFPVALCFKLFVSSCSNIWQQYLAANLEGGENCSIVLWGILEIGWSWVFKNIETASWGKNKVELKEREIATQNNVRKSENPIRHKIKQMKQCH